MKSYKHTELGATDGNLVSRIRLSTLQFRGKEVLLRHFMGDEVSDPFVMVPGFIAGAFMKPQGASLPTTQVAPVTDKALQDELSGLIRFFADVQDVYFWA